MGYQKKYEKVYEYILDCMDPDGFEEAIAEEKLRNFIESFVSDYNNDWYRKQWPAMIERTAQYLRGLPSSCSLDYDSYSIFLKGQEFGYISKDITTENLSEIFADKKANRFIDGWWNFIASRIFEMTDYYGINIPLIVFSK